MRIAYFLSPRRKVLPKKYHDDSYYTLSVSRDMNVTTIIFCYGATYFPPLEHPEKLVVNRGINQADYKNI